MLEYTIFVVDNESSYHDEIISKVDLSTRKTVLEKSLIIRSLFASAIESALTIEI